MPYVEKLIENIVDNVSDFGWEIASVEYDIDMIPDDEECPLATQEEQEVAFAYAVDEYSWNKYLDKKKRNSRYI